MFEHLKQRARQKTCNARARGILEFQSALGIQAVPFFGTKQFLFLEHGLFLISEPPVKQNLKKKATDVVKVSSRKHAPARAPAPARARARTRG